MPLTLRPIGLSPDPDRKHYAAHEDGQAIGRMYEEPAPSSPELAWFWSITVLGPARGRVKTDGRATTFEDANAQFAESWQAWKTW